MTTLRRILDWYTYTPPDLAAGEARIYTSAKIGYTVWILAQLLTAVIFFLIGQPELGTFNALGVFLTSACFVLLLRGRPDIGYLIVNAQNVAWVLLATAYTGLEPGFFLYALVGLIYSTLSEWVSRRVQAVLMAISAATFVGTLLLGLTTPPIAPMSLTWVIVFAVFNGTATASLLLMVGLTYRHTVDRAEAALEAEHEKSEALLHNIMPPSVAERLKANPAVIADSHQPVTILFADIVGFTDLAERSTPEELVTWLNTVFSRFDALVDDLELEKIKTVGDAYLVVAGLPIPRSDHAHAIARLALSMIGAADDLSRETKRDLQVRIGVHSGSVVAGVIGQKKFAYDIWGDTVNFASRMESHGVPGRIQVSADTAALLIGAFDLEARGEIFIKGKGKTTTYILTGEKRTSVNA